MFKENPYLFSSGVLHWHNYEAFATFPAAGEGTTVYMAPPSCYPNLKSTIRKAKVFILFVCYFVYCAFDG
jgi:hypothetical protein